MRVLVVSLSFSFSFFFIGRVQGEGGRGGHLDIYEYFEAARKGEGKHEREGIVFCLFYLGFFGRKRAMALLHYC